MKSIRGRGLLCLLLLWGLCSSSLMLAWRNPTEGETDRLHRTPTDKELHIFVLSPQMQMQVGAVDLTTLHQIVCHYENRLVGLLPNERKNLAGKLLGVSVRLGKTIYIDLPIARWFTIVQHEVFGHGARVREFRGEASYTLYHPWSRKRAFTSFRLQDITISDLIQVTGGGIESNQVMAWEMERRMYGENPLHCYDWLIFAINRYVVNQYINSTPDPQLHPQAFSEEYNDGGDIAAYLAEMNYKYHGHYGVHPEEADPLLADNYQRIKKEAIWNLLDPALWLGVYYYGRYILTGKEKLTLPMLPLWGIRLMGGTRYNLTPIGAERYLDLYIKKGRHLFNFYLRKGSFEEKGWYGWGCGADRLWRYNNSHLGLRLDWWDQLKTGIGGNLEGELHHYLTPEVGIILQGGYKTEGYLMGKPAAPGIYTFFGTLVKF